LWETRYSHTACGGPEYIVNDINGKLVELTMCEDYKQNYAGNDG
jgi:hypothetical protein